MALDMRTGMAYPKPETRKREKGRKDRAEATVLKAVRAACVARDGHCRLAGPDCDGPSTLAHLSGHRRSQTRGLPPEQRHSTEWCVMLCAACHAREESGEIELVPCNWWAGMNGPFRVYTRTPKTLRRPA